ncbi:MAG: DUF559 domain-containing protein [Planctomycetota bacterium]
MREPHPLLPARTLTNARDLRKRMPRPEVLVWQRLRGRRTGGFRWRRQHPVPPFILDFFCAELNLALEIDGLSHQHRQEADRSRQAFLEKSGVRVLRVHNDRVLENPDRVAGQILEVCRAMKAQRAPSPSPSPREGSQSS